MITVDKPKSPEDIKAISQLFNAYSEWCKENFTKYEMFDTNSNMFQSFNHEEIPGIYNNSGNFILLIKVDDTPTGCAFIRGVTNSICEMKRLYIQPDSRYKGLGLRLMESLLYLAKKSGYRQLNICSHSQFMTKAILMYNQYGFYPIDEYIDNPIQSGDTHMAFNLENWNPTEISRLDKIPLIKRK